MAQASVQYKKSRAVCYVKSWEVSQLKPPRDHDRKSRAARLGEIPSFPWSLRIDVSVAVI